MPSPTFAHSSGGYPGGYYAYGSVLPPRDYQYPSYNPDLDYY